MRIWTLAAVATLVAGLASVPAHAAEIKPSKRACAPGDYSCMQVSTRTALANQAVTFTGSLSPRALRNLRNWTAGEMDVCLDRYRTKPARDGWPSQSLPQACTTVKRDGTFTLVAELSQPGTFYYGLSAGECRADDGLCGAGDPLFLGPVGNKGNRAVTLTTR
jgi:hypothetical protein